MIISIFRVVRVFSLNLFSIILSSALKMKETHIFFGVALCQRQCEDVNLKTNINVQCWNWYILYFLTINTVYERFSLRIHNLYYYFKKGWQASGKVWEFQNPFSNPAKSTFLRKTSEMSRNSNLIGEQIRKIRYINYLLFFKINVYILPAPTALAYC